MDQARAPANMKHRHQHHLPPLPTGPYCPSHKPTQLSSSKAQKDVGRLWQVSQRNKGTNTHARLNILLIQTEDEDEDGDVGAKLHIDIQYLPKTKQKKNPKNSIQYFLQIFIFVGLEKLLKQKTKNPYSMIKERTVKLH